MEGIKVRNKTRRKTIVIDGVHYFADKPENCCYAKDRPCVSAVCYKELNRWMTARRKQKKGAINA